MATQTTCRRCTECEGREHHWIDNPDFGNENRPIEQQHSHICKHCEAFGDECVTCYGEGEEPGLEDEPCGACDGEGVRVAP